MHKKIVLLLSLLLLVSTSAFAAKPVIGVAEFTNDTSAAWWYGGVGDDLADMLTNELAGTNKFKVVERAKLGPVLEEQDLAASGRVSKSTGAKSGARKSSSRTSTESTARKASAEKSTARRSAPRRAPAPAPAPVPESSTSLGSVGSSAINSMLGSLGFGGGREEEQKAEENK